MAGERHAHHTQGFYCHLYADQAARAGIDMQWGGRAAQALGSGHVILEQPAFINQLTHQETHGGFGEPALHSQLRTREARLHTQQPQQHTAVDAFDKLLIASCFHGGQ